MKKLNKIGAEASKFDSHGAYRSTAVTPVGGYRALVTNSESSFVSVYVEFLFGFRTLLLSFHSLFKQIKAEAFIAEIVAKCFR